MEICRSVAPHKYTISWYRPLVSGLLVLSRLDAGEAQREWIDVDLAELTASTSEQMRLMAEDRGIHIESSALEPIVVPGDRGRLKQVIVNLLDNAIRFTPRGGTVTLRTAKSDFYNILEVHDTGTGIPNSALPQVFDRFFRVDDARSRDDGGAGLGLSIAKSICSAHGGRIEVDSEVGHGSCFRLMFPRQRVASGRGAAHAVAKDRGGAGESVAVSPAINRAARRWRAGQARLKGGSAVDANRPSARS